MLRNTDRFATWQAKHLRVGNRVRLPADDLMRPRHGLHRHTFEVVGFGGYSTSWCGPRDGSRPRWRERSSMAHTVTVRRLADGWTTTISQFFVTHYRDEWGASIDDSLGHKNLRRLALMRGDLQGALWMMENELYHFRQAKARDRQRALEDRYAGLYGPMRIAFTVNDDTPLPHKSEAA